MLCLENGMSLGRSLFSVVRDNCGCKPFAYKILGVQTDCIHAFVFNIFYVLYLSSRCVNRLFNIGSFTIHLTVYFVFNLFQNTIIFKEFYDYDFTDMAAKLHVDCFALIEDYESSDSESKVYNSRIRGRICSLAAKFTQDHTPEEMKATLTQARELVEKISVYRFLLPENEVVL